MTFSIGLNIQNVGGAGTYSLMLRTRVERFGEYFLLVNLRLFFNIKSSLWLFIPEVNEYKHKKTHFLVYVKGKTTAKGKLG